MGKSNSFLVFCLFLFLSDKCQALSCYKGEIGSSLGSTPTINNVTKVECDAAQKFCLKGELSLTISNISISASLAMCANSTVCNQTCNEITQLISMGNSTQGISLTGNDTNIISCKKSCCSTDNCNKIPSTTSPETAPESPKNESATQFSKNATRPTSGQSSGNMAAHVYLVCLGVFMSLISLILVNDLKLF